MKASTGVSLPSHLMANLPGSGPSSTKVPGGRFAIRSGSEPHCSSPHFTGPRPPKDASIPNPIEVISLAG